MHKTLNQYIRDLLVAHTGLWHLPDGDDYSKLYNYYEEAKRISGSNCGKNTYCAKIRNAGRKMLKEGFSVTNNTADTIRHFTEKTSMNEKEMVAERLFTREPQSLNDVELMYKIDTKAWTCTGFTVSNWDVTSTRVGKTATNYAVKATFKRRTDIINYDELKEKFLTDIKDRVPKSVKFNYKLEEKSKLLEVCIFDLHFGKLGWAPETGENYDYKIAEDRFLFVIQDIIEKTKHIQYERILFIVGNDMFHIDNTENSTTKGTRQDTDVRWQKIFDLGCRLLVQGIDILSSYAPVDVMWVKGNHDTATSYYATLYLDAWYRNNPNVDIDATPTPRKYYIYGNTLLGFTHGDKEGKRLNGIMQVERAKEWGITKYREWHMAHLHSEQVKEENGVIIRTISSICGTDAWHTDSGYVGAIQKAQSFVWDYETGLDMIINSVIK